MDPLLITGGLKLLGGLFGSKPPTPAKNILSQAQGAREAAAKYGFNPLTMLQYGQPGGAMGGGSPLASADLMAGALQDVSDVISGESERRNAANKLELELGRIKLDQLSAAGYHIQPSAVANVGSGLSPLGRGVATVGASYAAPVMAGFSVDPASGIRGVGSRVVPYAVMVPTQGSDGITRQGANPAGPDMDQALWALGTDAYYRRTNFVANHTISRPLRASDGDLMPPRPSTDVLDPDHKRSENRGPWRRFYDGLAWPSGSPTSSNFP